LKNNLLEFLFNQLKKPWINTPHLENLRVFIQSWMNITEETISHFVSIFNQLTFKKIKSLEIGFEWFKFIKINKT